MYEKSEFKQEEQEHLIMAKAMCNDILSLSPDKQVEILKTIDSAVKNNLKFLFERAATEAEYLKQIIDQM